MSKRGFISRYMMIIKRLKAKPFSSFDSLEQYVIQQVEHLHMQDDNLSMGFSKRTLQRDIHEIRMLFGIDIIYDGSRKGYYLVSNEYESTGFQRMMEAYDVFNSLNMVQDMDGYIAVESRKPAGTENMYGLMHAIKNNFTIRFKYNKYEDESIRQRSAEPYLLKEFRNRWYVMAIDINGRRLKSFALDRLTDLEITGQKFARQPDLDIEELYRHSFGIISNNGPPSQQIVLSFDPLQGKYIKSLPLHNSQQIEFDNDNELRIRLNVHVTHDLIMEIRSFGENVKVIEPLSLKLQIQDSLKKTLNIYNE
jgi:predicted DNA-binding transcriptional regulator YafY